MHRHFAFALLLAALFSAGSAFAQEWTSVADLEAIEHHFLPQFDAKKARLADEERAASGRVPHYAVAFEVGINPFDEINEVGDWDLPGGDVARWRLRLTSPGALSLNLVFSRYRMPSGGRLLLTSADGRHLAGPFTARDNETHGELWTPPIPTDDLVLELSVPAAELDSLELELSRVHHGYAGFGEPGYKSGDCHRDVVCSEAEAWRDQARSVALISVEGVRYCTGFLVNNTALDGRPFFITASHCGVTARNAASVVVLWNYQRSVCAGADQPTIDLDQFQSGALFRAAHLPSDTALLELDDVPDPAFGVYYAGWDRSRGNPLRSTVIHHPNTDVKRISFDVDRATTTSHLRTEPRYGSDHIRVGGWDLGSTEGGSSGAPLFNHDKRVVGQLHGGYAACGDPRADWFGRFSAAWTGRGRPGLRLSDWLDPLGTGTMTLDGLDAEDRRIESSEARRP